MSEIAPLLIVTKLEALDHAGAAAIATVMLLVSFGLLVAINCTEEWARHRHGGEVRRRRPALVRAPIILAVLAVVEPDLQKQLPRRSGLFAEHQRRERPPAMTMRFDFLGALPQRFLIGGADNSLGAHHARGRAACDPIGPDEIGNRSFIFVARHVLAPPERRSVCGAGEANADRENPPQN